MRALIYEVEGAVGVGARDIAGRPLLVRQLQWLRDLGIEDVAVEVALGPSALERGELLLGSDPLASRCITIPTRTPVGIETLADRADVEDDELFLALPADALAHARFEPPRSPVRFALSTPAGTTQEHALELLFRTRHTVPSAEPTPQSGWGVHLRDDATAHALSCAALHGQLEGILVHGAEVRPGIWFARGARVVEDVTLVPPVLIGAGSRVFGGARLGPNVILGASVVVEREAVLSEVSVAPDTLIGEGARIRHAHVDARGMTSLADGARTDVREPLLLASTRSDASHAGARLAALVLLALLVLPWALASTLFAVIGRRPLRKLRWNEGTLYIGTLGMALLDLVPPLYDVVRGARDLIGVALPSALEEESALPDRARRAGAIDVTDALAPHASRATLRCMWRWYLQNKTPALDRALVGTRFTGRVE